MKEVMISIRPKWCDLIAQGKKTIEIRKRAPKLQTPFKCYIYCTMGGASKASLTRDIIPATYGMVIGEFTCTEIVPIVVFDNGAIQHYICDGLNASCVPYEDIANYIGNGRTGYGWRISDVVIYGEPRYYGEFKVKVDAGIWSFTKKLERPPQSWCYVIGGAENANH